MHWTRQSVSPDSAEHTHAYSRRYPIHTAQRRPVRTRIIDEHHQQRVAHPHDRHKAQYGIHANTRPPRPGVGVQDPARPIWRKGRFERLEQVSQTWKEEVDGYPAKGEHLVGGADAEPAPQAVQEQELARYRPETVDSEGVADGGCLEVSDWRL